MWIIRLRTETKYLRMWHIFSRISISCKKQEILNHFLAKNEKKLINILSYKTVIIVPQGGKGSSEGKKVQRILTSKYVMGILNWFKIVKNKKNHEAILEIAVNMHSPFCPKLVDQPSKMASWILLILTILNHINIPILNFEVRLCWTFFPSELPLLPWVTVKAKTTMLIFLLDLHIWDQLPI